MDTQTTPFRHRTTTWYLAWPGTLWPQDFIRGRLASLFEAKGNQVKTLSFFPGLDLRAVVDLSRPYDCPDLSVFDLDVPVHWARRGIGFHTRDSRTHLVVVTSLPDDDLLGSLALDPRTPGVSPPGPGDYGPRLVLVASLRPSRSP